MLGAYHNYHGQFVDGNGNFWASLRTLTQAGRGEKVLGVCSQTVIAPFSLLRTFPEAGLLKFLVWNLIFSEFA